MMADNNGNGSSSYQNMDRKIEAVEENFRADNAALRNEFRQETSAIRQEVRDLGTSIMNRIDRSAEQANTNAKPTNPYQLIGTAVSIILALGSAGSYVASSLSAGIAANLAAVNGVAASTSHSLDELSSNIQAGLKVEENARIDDRRRIYDIIERDSLRAWSKDAQAEYDKRIDQRDAMEREYTEREINRDHHELDLAAQVDQEKIRALETNINASLDRIVQHLNKSDDHAETKFAEVDKSIHGYGLGDEVKDLQTQVRDALDKIFRLAAPGVDLPKTKPLAD